MHFDSVICIYKFRLAYMHLSLCVYICFPGRAAWKPSKAMEGRGTIDSQQSRLNTWQVTAKASECQTEFS